MDWDFKFVSFSVLPFFQKMCVRFFGAPCAVTGNPSLDSVLFSIFSICNFYLSSAEFFSLLLTFTQLMWSH